jgi:hypothetical protein
MPAAFSEQLHFLGHIVTLSSQKIICLLKIIPGFCLLLIFVLSTVYFIVLDWCLLEVSNIDCGHETLTVTITCFSLVYELVLCFHFALSFYCGTLKCEHKIEILTHMEKAARVLRCTEQINAGAKKINKLFLTVAWPGT